MAWCIALKESPVHFSESMRGVDMATLDTAKLDTAKLNTKVS